LDEKNPQSKKESPGAPKEAPSLPALLNQQAALDRKIKEDYYREKTFLAIDVDNPEELKKDSDKDDVHFTIEAYRALVKKIIDSFAGQIHETSGDGIMSVFDSADEACSAAIAIANQMPDFNIRQNQILSSDRHKKSMILRVGINTGQVIFDEKRGIGELFDRIIDTAGHLQKYGKPGEVMITENTYNALPNKKLFVKDKFWEEKQVQLYRYTFQTANLDAKLPAEDEFKDMQKLTPLVDAVAGKTYRDIRPGELVWFKTAAGIFTEGRILNIKSDDEFCLMEMGLPDGSMGYARFRLSLRLCGSSDRAMAFARKAFNPEFRQFSGDQPVVQFDTVVPGQLSSTSYLMTGGIALFVLLAVGAAFLLLFK